VSAAKERAIGFDAVAHDLATAMLADRSQLVNGALEAVERMGVSGSNDLEREIVVVATDLTSSHMHLLVIEQHAAAHSEPT
jgi:hypothetical protein